MTAPTNQPAPEKITAAELRTSLANLHAELESMKIEYETMREEVRAAMIHLQRAAASQPATAAATAGQSEVMDATRIIRTRTSGKWYYKLQGGQYVKRGVTVWDEILKILNLDPATMEWDAQDGYTFPEPLRVRLQMKEYIDEETGEKKMTPQKVTGKA